MSLVGRHFLCVQRGLTIKPTKKYDIMALISVVACWATFVVA